MDRRWADLIREALAWRWGQPSGSLKPTLDLIEHTLRASDKSGSADLGG